VRGCAHVLFVLQENPEKVQNVNGILQINIVIKQNTEKTVKPYTLLTYIHFPD